MQNALSYLSAIVASLCWAVAPVIAVGPIQKLGILAYAQVRFIVATFIVVLVAMITSTWDGLTSTPFSSLITLFGSSLVGILLADTLLVSAIGKAGPRRASILYSTSSPITLLSGSYMLGEYPSSRQILGFVICLVGIYLAIFFRGVSAQKVASSEKTPGDRDVIVGIVAGLGAALFQALGLIALKAAMLHLALPSAPVAALRLAMAAVLANLLILPRWSTPSSRAKFDKHTVLRIFGAAFVAYGVGSVLFTFSVAHTRNVAIVGLLSSLAPVLVLPVVWLQSGVRPSGASWIGAAVAVGGVSVIVTA